MRARAPGKVVLSGAYSVLAGAPGVVSAIDRYAYSDSDRPARRTTPEVQAALGDAPAPHFEADELRTGDRKLGLGSSAAILVASLAAARAGELRPGGEEDFRRAIFAQALRAHRQAQGGGSGIDVAASTWGGTLIATMAGETLELQAIALPKELVIEVWSSSTSASTKDFLASVERFRARAPEAHGAVMKALCGAAVLGAQALIDGDARTAVVQLDVQCEALRRLGLGAGVPIVTDEAMRLAELAREFSAVVLPSGAGGGDIVLWVGPHPSPAAFHALAAELRHDPLALALHAPGVQCWTEGNSTLGS